MRFVTGGVLAVSGFCVHRACSRSTRALEGRGECPACGQNLGPLAARVPKCKRVLGRVLCSLTGESIGEGNPGVVLPDGHVCGAQVRTSPALHPHPHPHPPPGPALPRPCAHT